MKIDVDQKYHTVLKEVYDPVVLETEERNRLWVCMRDDTIELTVEGSDRHWRVDMETGGIYEL